MTCGFVSIRLRQLIYVKLTIKSVTYVSGTFVTLDTGLNKGGQGGIVKWGVRHSQSGVAGEKVFLLSAVTLSWKMGTGTGGDCPNQELSPFCAGASPHFHDAASPVRRQCRTGTPCRAGWDPSPSSSPTAHDRRRRKGPTGAL